MRVAKVRSMTFTDFLIIYLAFGAPLGVYKYLQNRTADFGHRAALSILTFFFWIPVLIELGYLYLANAYSRDGFVSHRNSDASDQRVRLLRESVTAELIRFERGANLHNTRETVDRYVGLASEVQGASFERAGRNEFFEAAGRRSYELGQLCLMRRNLRRLERHHIQARNDFVELLDQVSRRFAAPGVIGRSLDLARHLEDHDTVGQLIALQAKRGGPWNSAHQEQSQILTSVQPIAVTASLNND
jgi:hypothetical protein